MKWDFSDMDTWKADEFPLGAVIPEAGNSQYYVTGGWRSERPVWTEEKCTQCLQCFIFCPDSAITVADEKMTGFNLDHCKGCGICRQVCPANPKFDGDKAIDMVPEGCELPGVST